LSCHLEKSLDLVASPIDVDDIRSLSGCSGELLGF
jgi:hypothetical protein